MMTTRPRRPRRPAESSAAGSSTICSVTVRIVSRPGRLRTAGIRGPTGRTAALPAEPRAADDGVRLGRTEECAGTFAKGRSPVSLAALKPICQINAIEAEGSPFPGLPT